MNAPARFGLVAFLAGAVLAIGLTAVLWLDVLRRIDELAVTRSDNTQWTVSQLEVDHLRLVLAAEDASAGGAGAVDRMRQRFDIFYSRWRTLGRAEAYRRLASDAVYDDAAQEIDRFLDRGVALVDAPDAVLLAALPGLRAEIDSLHEPVRAIALRGVDIFAEVSDRQRAEIVMLILRTGLVTVLLLLVLAVAAFLMIVAGRGARAAARKLEEVNLNLAMIVDTSLDAIVVTDEAGVVRVYNPAAETVFGWSRNEAIGQPMTRLMIPARHHAAHEAGMKRFLETGEKRVIGKGRIQLDARHKSGRIFPVELSIAHEHTANGHVFVSFLRDITHRRRVEDDLRTARDEALTAARKKSEFLAIMSHEIRTPLNGILGSIDLLRDGVLDDAQRRLVATMRESGEILLGHVNDVLNLTRLETGQATLALQPVDLRAVFAKVLENQFGAAQEAGNSMTMEVAPDVPRIVSADERRLSQILLNLVGNANKFTSNGAIVLSARCVRRTEETARITIDIADTGVGIPTEDRERVFEDFVMLDTSYQRNAQGAGLGLGITRRLVQAMGGTIEISGAPGGGANFRIDLDLDLAVAATPEAVRSDGTEGQAFRLQPLSILMVEDNDINRSVLRAMLEREGQSVVEACDGQAGVETAEQQRFDLILMDISMPGMNGTEAARAIRDGQGPNASTPMVATTAHALPDEIEAFRAHGMDRTLTKPIKRSALRALLAEHSPQPAEVSPARHEIDLCDVPEEAVLLDVEKLAILSEIWGQDRFRKTLAQFMSEATAFEVQLRNNPPTSEPGTLATEAHRLAGAAGSLGFPALNALFVDFETVCKTRGRRLDRNLTERLAHVSQRTRDEIFDLLAPCDDLAAP